MRGNLDFNDMLQTVRMMKKMGPMSNILKLIPGLTTALPAGALDKGTGRIEAIILSMTPNERTNPDSVDAPRRARIAKGSGTSIEEVDNLFEQFYGAHRRTRN